MKIFNSFEELAQYFNKPTWEVEKIYDNQFYRGIFVIGNQEIKVHVRENRLTYVIFNAENNEACKEYFMAYEKDLYSWKVYVDDIEKWQPCEVLDVYNDKLEITRAVVITPNNTQLNRRCKYVFDEEEVKQDGCIYFLDKE